MRYGLFVPPFGELADPGYLGELAARAEEAGWDGVFLWDHMVFRGVPEISDPWICLAAMAGSTSTIRLGPMVTPLPRRRPLLVARQVAALDQLSRGRMVLGVGLGDLIGDEFATLGEEVDPRVRAELLDESLDLVTGLLSGEVVEHGGPHFRVGQLQFLPRSVQQPLPVWVAARWPKRAPLRRAVRYQGVFVIQLRDPAEIVEMRGALGGFGAPGPNFEIVVTMAPGTDPRPWREAGVTWFLNQVGPSGLRRSEVEAVVAAGPLRR